MILNLLSLVSFAVLLAPATEPAPESTAPGKAASASSVRRLLAEFRRAKNDPAKREEVAAEAIRAGAPAVDALVNALRREMQPELARYGTKLYQRALGVMRQHFRQVDPQKVARLRATILNLQQGDRLTKETIVAEGDPALQKLSELLVVDRRQVLQDAPALQADREKLLATGRVWEKLARFLHDSMPDDEQKPKSPPSFEEYLAGEEDLAVGLAAPMDPATKAILAGNARVAGQIDPEEARCILAMNLTRNLVGLPALAIDVRLCAAARDHSKDMAEQGFFAHESPVPGKKTPWDRAKRFGATAGAENIYAGSTDGKAAHEAWWHSPGHHRNLMGKHQRVGVGRFGRHFTQLFGD